MQQTQKRCFHCGRSLAACVQGGGCDCCNYCSILSNLLGETVEPKKRTEVRDVFLLLFVLLTAALAILMYYWKDETIQLVRQAESVLRKLYLRVCCLPMSSFSVEDEDRNDGVGLGLPNSGWGEVLLTSSPNRYRRSFSSHGE